MPTLLRDLRMAHSIRCHANQAVMTLLMMVGRHLGHLTAARLRRSLQCVSVPCLRRVYSWDATLSLFSVHTLPHPPSCPPTDISSDHDRRKPYLDLPATTSTKFLATTESGNQQISNSPSTPSTAQSLGTYLSSPRDATHHTTRSRSWVPPLSSRCRPGCWPPGNGGSSRWC